MKNSGSEDLESYFPFRPECRDDMPKTTRFKPRSGKTLSRRKWEAAFNEDGQLDMAGEVWEFLLGCFDPKSTSTERKELMQRRRKRRAIDIVRNSTVTTVHTIQAEKDESLYTIHWSTTSVQTSMRHRKLGNYNHRIRLYLEATVKIFGWWNFYVPQPIEVEHSRGKLRRCARGGYVVGKCYYVAMRGFKFVN